VEDGGEIVTDVLHVITPGDHFSPRTGSAIPTVVDGLAAAAARDGARFHQFVVLDRTTMTPRYLSASPIGYPGVPRPSRRERYIDLLAGLMALPRSGMARYYEPVATAIRARAPGIVVAHNAPVLPWILRDTAHRKILFVHNELLRTYSRIEAARVLDHADRIICVSPWLAESTASRLPSRFADRIRVVPNGVDIDRFAPNRGDAEPRGGPLRVLFVGRTIELKGPEVLLRAVTLLDRDDVEVRIVGSHGFARGFPLTPYELRLREIAARSRSRVSFEPFVDREALPQVFGGADVLVVPSVRSEASGLTAGEGMASGLAVVASGIGGLPGVVGDAGVTVPPGDSGALAAVIAELVDDRDRLRSLQEAGRARALTRDWNWAWTEFRRVLEEL
jgi:glycosyltransferase involved in cell wall biosynthesis